MYRNLVVGQLDSLSLWERAGVRALVREARNNSPGFSPLSRRVASQLVKAFDAGEEFLNGFRAEARSNVVVAICAKALSQKERELNRALTRNLFCLLLCLIMSVCALGQKASDATPNVVGTWEGTLDAGAAKLKPVLHIEDAKDGALVGRLDVPAQGASDLPIDSLSIAGSTLKFEMKSLGATYEGKLESNGNQITGEFKQGGQAFPLVFNNTGRTATKSLLSGNSDNRLRSGSRRRAGIMVDSSKQHRKVRSHRFI
jgi:hypothetical protein